MAKRVGIVLSGCGSQDGSEIREAILLLLSAERARAEVIFAAPDVPQGIVVDHLTGDRAAPKPARRVLSEAARIARGKIRPLAQLTIDQVDALLFPGGAGVGLALSNYAERGELCDVDADVTRLLKGALASHRPMGFVCLSPILAARVLGPIAGVRVTLGPRGSAAVKHAAIMGADVRPCATDDVVVDKKARVVSTPAYMDDDAPLPAVAIGVDKLVRTVLGFAVDRNPAPPPAR